MPTDFISTFGGKFIIVLLIVGIIATAVSNVGTTLNNERIVQEQEDNLAEQATQTRELVQEHHDTTARLLGLIEEEQEEQIPLLNKFNMHINQTATAAPLVQQNNEILIQILAELQDINNNITDNGDNNNSTDIP